MSTELIPPLPEVKAPAKNFPIPKNACDSHIHIFNDLIPTRKDVDHLARPCGIAEYKSLQNQLKLQRAVVVTPSLYGTDNRATLQAIGELGVGDARGVAVLYPDVTDEELDVLHQGGVRGIRFSLYNPTRAATTFEMVEPLAERVQRLGWHVQLYLSPDQVVNHAAMLRRLAVPLVFDHMLRLGSDVPITHGAFEVVADLVARGRAWIKLSGAYLNSKVEDYSDTKILAQALINLNPDRMVWGSDWPHPTQHTHVPDDQELLNLLAQWAPDDALRHRILVDNPAQLYEFA